MASYSYRDGIAAQIAAKPEVLQRAVAPFGHKLAWFEQRGYTPHFYQLLFHIMSVGLDRMLFEGVDPAALSDDDFKLKSNRDLAAGRRGGKTHSGAWDCVYYCVHPEQFHWQIHRKTDTRPILGWVISPDHANTGTAVRDMIASVLQKAGLVENLDYRWNRTEKTVYFANGSRITFKSAEKGSNLVGAGNDFIWEDEAALMADDKAHNYAVITLDDKEGVRWGTTTPRSKNWYWKLHFNPKPVGDEKWSPITDPDYGNVQYRSIDNPYFPAARWAKRKKTMHPQHFKQEYEAAFDSMAGVELSGDWLRYWTYSPDDTTAGAVLLPERDELEVYIGVDPAISLAADADHFAMAAIGVHKTSGDCFLLDTFLDRLPFHEQLAIISEWYTQWRPRVIGVEAQAYQAALAQEVARLNVLPVVNPIKAIGKKSDRILSMSPYFQYGKVRINELQQDFVHQWINYDSKLKNPEDDLLDAVEIALRTAGILLPLIGDDEDEEHDTRGDWPSLQERAMLSNQERPSGEVYDPELGSCW